jgi:uncharacterized membrane protein YraQ (UPF0718 family)
MKQNKDTKNKGNKRPYSMYFLAFVIVLYLVLLVIDQKKMQESLILSWNLFVRILPAMLFIILFMGIMNYAVRPGTVMKYMGKAAGGKGWLLAVLTGILSHGPIYAWYPLLKELKTQGAREGLIAVFLYNRAIKIPLLPLLIYYFGLAYAIVLLFYMVAASLIEGVAIDFINKGA